ncbi:MAG: family 9 glycosyl hydrolase [Benjaminiella poitrasii]|nr:MAG: family 9 glycosyl hydrolase [Benjaminiella poitrasii]
MPRKKWSLSLVLTICIFVCQTTSKSLIVKRDVLIPKVKVPSAEYVNLLSKSILFYEAQRSGKLPENNRIPWRNDSALNDGVDVNLDLSGGYYDAGDYLKFTFPLSYSVFMLSWGGTDFIHGYKLANQTVHLRNQIKWATDWLIKAHPNRSTLFVQIGEDTVDNNSFGPDTDIPTPRPSYQINETYFGTDVAAMTAAAFASASILFRTLAQVTDFNKKEDTMYADLLLQHASQLYDAAYHIRPYVIYHDSVPAVRNVYGSTDYVDDLLLSSLVMYKATSDSTYLNNLYKIADEFPGNTDHNEPLDWDNKWGAYYVMLAEVLNKEPTSDRSRKARQTAEKYLDDIVSGKTANRTNGGLLYWDFHSDYNSNSNAMSTSCLLLSYSCKVLNPLLSCSSKEKDNNAKKKKQYEELAESQLDYIFGKNPMNQNYIVGVRDNSPKNPHSAPASGYASLKDASIATKNGTARHAHILFGALIGGPAKNDSFDDSVLTWSQTEIALDYNAPYQNILAYHIMFSELDPYYLPAKNRENTGDDIIPTAIKVGIIFSVILGTTLLGGIVFLGVSYYRGKQVCV